MKALLMSLVAAVAACVAVPASATFYFTRCDTCPINPANPTTQAVAVGVLSSAGAVVNDTVGICKTTGPTSSFWIGYVVLHAPVTSAADIQHNGSNAYVDMNCDDWD